MANAVLELVDLSLPLMKELGAKRLTEMAEYLSTNPQFVVNGLICSGITRALDHNNESNVAESVFTCDEDEEDSDYQEDSDDEEDSNDEEDSDEDDDGNDEEEYPDDPDEPSGSVGHPDEIVVLE